MGIKIHDKNRVIFYILKLVEWKFFFHAKNDEERKQHFKFFFPFFLFFFLAFCVCSQESEAKGLKLFVIEEAESIMADKAPPPHF